jgi:hypothetical protein
MIVSGKNSEQGRPYMTHNIGSELKKKTVSPASHSSVISDGNTHSSNLSNHPNS